MNSDTIVLPWVRDSGESEARGQATSPALPTQLFQLHPAILEPYLHLSVRQVDTVADLQTPLPTQIHVEQELFLQLQSLVLGVGTALLPAAARRQPVAGSLAFILLSPSKRNSPLSMRDNSGPTMSCVVGWVWCPSVHGF